MEEIPIADAEVDLVFFSQSLHHALHPERALQDAHRILVPGGRIVILDLARHRFEEARELYADEWLGFSEADLEAMLERAGLHQRQHIGSRQGTRSPPVPNPAGRRPQTHSLIRSLPTDGYPKSLLRPQPKGLII